VVAGGFGDIGVAARTEAALAAVIVAVRAAAVIFFMNMLCSPIVSYEQSGSDRPARTQAFETGGAKDSSASTQT
jgi:hypothetical protein